MLIALLKPYVFNSLTLSRKTQSNPQPLVQVSDIRRYLRNDGCVNGVDENTKKKLFVVGFDTETKPSFKPPQNKIALIQIAVSTTKCYLFKLNAICHGTRYKIPQVLLDFLSDRSVLKVGVAVTGDEHSIRARAPSFRSNNTFVDISELAKKRFPSFNRTGLRHLTGTLLRQRLSKAQQMSNWNERNYSAAQKRYAALDAIVGLVLWRVCLGLVSLPPFPDSERLKVEDRGPWVCMVCNGKEFPNRKTLIF